MGAALSNFKQTIWPTLQQSFPPKSKFTVEDIPDLTGRIVIVTGGNVGIGYETVKALLQHNAKVYLAARSKNKAEKAINSLKEATGKEAIFLQLDLSSLSSVKKAAEEFLSKEPELHILFNNAGVMVPPIEQVTADGYDLQWGTNVLGHYYFTVLLLPALLAGVKSSPDHHARVVTTASSGAYLDTLHWETFKDTPERKKLSKENLYFQSKFGNVVFARQLAKRYAEQGIISVSVNPGNIQSDLQRHLTGLQRKLVNAMLYPTPIGAITQLYAGTAPEALNHNGEFFIPWARVGRCRPEAYDDELGEKLWKWLEDEVKAHEA
ncbi:NAD(P)-binding protein [Dichomitus squalens]|uniref:NAD(P)-binding protein n=1 Tax=Dichomitus squalens TaxID=114155 RepID=A0A4Q9MF27_9APHY|nr:NAD(P)-binding protein [Dichomitus squalens]TBU37637.1 NAD(P)-binding protein [Dichomitus squalens]TBU54819.1 NAD(P)-binding protein [Dichomitus squalens]